MTKKEMKEQLRDIKVQLEGIMKVEKLISYDGDDDFGDCVSHVFGDIHVALADVKTALRA